MSKIKNKHWGKKENYWIGAGFVVIIAAVITPFAIMYNSKSDGSLRSFEKLGTVGDFFGGTTVGLLSLASILFVTAAIVMQKEELSLQREEVKKTREEYEITNATMKKQQFDSTFFNMINLHHRITDDLQISKEEGRKSINYFLRVLKTKYNNQIKNDFEQEFLLNINRYVFHKDLVDEFIRKIHLAHNQQKYLDKSRSGPFASIVKKHDFLNNIARFKVSIVEEQDEGWIKQKEELCLNAEIEKILSDEELRNEWIIKFEFNKNTEFPIEDEVVSNFNELFKKNPLKELKEKAFKVAFEEIGEDLGHYIRNLYQTFKLVSEAKFYEDEELNTLEKKKYFGILRAQLSSDELLLLFYNAVYSEKGANFKKILTESHFFEDHLNKRNFVWANDEKELEQFTQKNAKY